MNNDQIILPSSLNNITSEQDVVRQVLSNHPSDSFIKAYVEGQIERGQHSHEKFQALSEGQAKDWQQAEVGLHIKTCEQCWQKMVGFRTAEIEISEPIVASTSVKTSWIDKLFAPFQQPAPLALAGVLFLIVALTIGYQMYPWMNAPVEEGLPAPSTSSFSVDPTLAEEIVTALENAGVPLDAFDFTLAGSDYRIQPQDTLQTIAIQQYDDISLWIGIYLYNYEALSSLEAPAMDTLPEISIELPQLSAE